MTVIGTALIQGMLIDWLHHHYIIIIAVIVIVVVTIWILQDGVNVIGVIHLDLVVVVVVVEEVLYMIVLINVFNYDYML